MAVVVWRVAQHSPRDSAYDGRAQGLHVGNQVCHVARIDTHGTSASKDGVDAHQLKRVGQRQIGIVDVAGQERTHDRHEARYGGHQASICVHNTLIHRKCVSEMGCCCKWVLLTFGLPVVPAV